MDGTTTYDIEIEHSFFNKRLESAAELKDIMEIRRDVLGLLMIAEYQLKKVDICLEKLYPNWHGEVDD